MAEKIPKYLKDLIAEKEGLHLDFKFEVSDYSKIARSLVAFANTDGGKLLIGVKDNGRIAGVRSEEELYMIQGAAKLYCRPAIDYYFTTWQIGKKSVLEVTIPKSKKRPHYAKDDQGRWRAYIRVNDKNFVANTVMIRVWKNLENPNRQPISIQFKRKEDFLLKFLSSHEYITFSKLRSITGLDSRVVEDMLVDLITINVVEISFDEQGTAIYRLSNTSGIDKIINEIPDS